MKENASGSGRSEGSIQSIGRAFELLEHMADLGGVASLSQLGAASHLPMPTIHRMIRTLVDLGYVRQQPSRKYALGPGLIRLGDGASRLFGFWATPYLKELVAATGESANLALLNGDHVVYTAQVQGLHSMRMFTEVGWRAWSHSTAVGKAMLAQLPTEQVRAIVAPSGMPAQTPNTITSLEDLEAELARIREQGYAVDHEEHEIGVRCVAVALPGRPMGAALSVSGPSPRMTEAAIQQAVPLLSKAAIQLLDETLLGDQ